MADAYLHQFYRGVLLPKIAYSLGAPKADHKRICNTLHKAFKEYLCVNSTAEFSNYKFLVYMSAILMLMARERGTLIPFFNEPDNCEDLTMKEWIELQKIIDK